MPTVLFYILGGVAVAATLVCITRRHPVHAVVYLVNAIFALALMFYLLGAPLVAAWEVIIYAGAIMVLFLFILMMFDLGQPPPNQGPAFVRWGPLVLLSAVLLACTVLLMTADTGGPTELRGYQVSPRAFGEALFHEYVLGVEVISLQLLFAAVGAFYLGRCERGPTEAGKGAR